MLRSLSIRDVVLIEAIDIDFHAGLNVLTGETGAGKSILLDALGFALGQRPRRELVRAGAGQGSVTAEFAIGPDHPVRATLTEAGLAVDEGMLILRRVGAANSPSRGFVNDQRVSAEVLREIGAQLVEVHGQHDDRGLLDPKGHRAILDSFSGDTTLLAAVQAAWLDWQNAENALSDAQAALEQAAADADFLRHSVEELEALSPQPGEDVELDSERRLIRQAADLVGEISQAAEALSRAGAEGALSDALNRLTGIADRSEGRMEPAIAALDRTLAELAEAQALTGQALEAMTFDPGRLEDIEERFFALRALARKHNVAPDELADLTANFSTRLEEIDAGEDRIGALEGARRTANKAYDVAAQALSGARRAAAEMLDDAVTRELAPLKMENARFVTEIGVAPPGPAGTDAVRFTATINPGAPPGPIDRIASGGELSRFLLALKVQLADRSEGLTMIFDEIDRGVGGATADAVGRRLSRLAVSGQVLVVTHSPQVAAQGQHHFQIRKTTDQDIARTEVVALDPDACCDEIARMLAGGRVTDQARLAARALIDEAR